METKLNLGKMFLDWWNCQDVWDALARVNSEKHQLSFNLAEETGRVIQLTWLLSQAPMQFAPPNLFEAQRSVAKFAYINPTTMMKIMQKTCSDGGLYPIRATTWVLTSLMPEGCVIYGPNAMPGYESLMHGTIAPNVPESVLKERGL